jgi:pimeloyl-ACP methyl ester carboxylesterase
MADVLAEAMTTLGIGPAAVCGVSMGGDVALNLALTHPERVAGLVLIAPGGLAPALGSAGRHRAAWLAAQLPDPVLLPAGRLANRFARAALRNIVKDPARLPAEVVDEFARLARDPRSVLGYSRYNQATLGRDRMLNDLTGRVQRISVPALFFHGADDPIVNPEGSRRAAELMPRARLVLVPDCGHWAQLERHDEFLAEVRPFLADLDSGTTHN